jgi:type II secretory pathway component GspD/PulD (secretin)
MTNKGKQFGLLALLLAALLMAAPMSAQDDEPQPDDPITIDFVKKDIHTVMHFIALRSGLKIIVDGQVNVQLTVMYRSVKPNDAIESICKANQLDMVKDGEFIIIKRRASQTAQANVVDSETTGRFNVSFERQPLVEAIMEVAKVSGTAAFIPAVAPSSGAQPGGDPNSGANIVQTVQSREISMFMRDASADDIFRRLASLGDMELEEDTSSGYSFKYKVLKAAKDPVGVGGDDKGAVDPADLEVRDWTLPGADVVEIGKQLGNMISPVGKVVTDKVVGYIMVMDLKAYMPHIEKYMTKLGGIYDAHLAKLEADADNMMTREYRINRDVTDPTILAGVTSMLSDGGVANVNPERNSVIVRDLESSLEGLDRYFKSFDAKPQQVLITAKLVEVLLDDYIGYGLQMFTQHEADSWENGTFAASSQDSANSNTVQGLFGQPTGFDPFFATFLNSRIDVRLELLANESRVETLAQPSQLVANRRTAKIDVGQEVPYLASSSTGTGGGNTTATVSFKDITISLEITPTILEDGLMRLEVIMSTREVIDEVAIEGNNTPVLSKRETDTELFVRDGETVAMGGLIRERTRHQENGLPFLKDIPFLGYLFKSENKTTEKNDLVFFLRPQIVTMNARQSFENDGNAASGKHIQRDLRPLIIGTQEGDNAGLRPKRYRTLGKTSKPKWYNDRNRPKKAADVNPGQ